MSAYHTDQKISDHYKFQQELGRGSFAIVRSAINRQTGVEYAVKIFNRTHLDSDEEESLQLEVEILSTLDHPNVVKLYEIFDEGTVLYLVMELMQGGELFDRIVEKEAYSEREAIEVIRPIVDAIRYCHENGIIHRDLKPENLLYETCDEKSIIKISDFGLARYVDTGLATTACGTPGYVAPEIVKGVAYGKEVDYWSVGIIVYIMLCGFPPFYEENNQLLFEKIENCDFEFPDEYWGKISDNAKDLIKRILVAKPEQRLTAEQILEHPWLNGDDESCGDAQLAAVPKKISEYNARQKLRKAGQVIIAVKRLNKLFDQSQNDIKGKNIKDINDDPMAFNKQKSKQDMIKMLNK